jgi:hypothetical protein
MASGANLSQGIDIVIRDQVAATISPKLQGFANDAASAEAKLTALQGALSKLSAGNLSAVSAASTGMARSMGNAAGAIDRLSSAAQAADGNLQRLVLQLQVVSAAANQATISFQNMGTSATAASNAAQNLRTSAASAGSGMSGLSGGTRMVSSELSVLEGRMMGSNRAAGAFLTSVLGLGPVLSAAFPVIGAIALIGVLGQMVGAVQNLTNRFKELGAAQRDAEIGDIQNNQKTLKPSQGMFASLMDRVMGAQPQTTMVVQDTSEQLKQITQQRQLADAQATVNEQGKTGVALQQQKVKDVQREIELTKQAQVQAQTIANNAQKKLSEQHSVTYQTGGGGSAFGTGGGGTLGTRNVSNIVDPKQVAALETQMKAGQQAAADYGHEIEMLGVKLQGANLREGAASAKDAMQKLMDGWKAGALALRGTSTDIAGDMKTYWDAIASTPEANKANAARKYAQNEMLEADSRFEQEVLKNNQKFTTLSSTIGRQEQNKALDYKPGSTDESTIKNLDALVDSANKYRGAMAAVNEADQLRSVQIQLETNQISKQTAAQDELNIKLAAYQAQINALKNDQQNNVARYGAGRENTQEFNANTLNNSQQQAQLQSQMAQLQAGNIGKNPQGFGQAAGGALQKVFPQADFQEVEKNFQQLFTTISDGFADSIGHSLVYATSLSKAFENVARQGIAQLISGLIKLGEQLIITKLESAFLSTLGGGGAGNGYGFADNLASAFHLASGGPVGGKGGPNDDANMAFLSRGEYVVNASATGANRQLLNMINSGASVLKANTQMQGPSQNMRVTVEDHTMGGTTFQVNHLDDNSVRIIARQEIQNGTDGHVANAITNPNSRTSKALAMNTQTVRRRNG